MASCSSRSFFYGEHQMTQATAPEFGRVRGYFWPIRSRELRKFIPMLLMAFCIGFAYHILRNMKDSLLVTAPSSGAEVIPFVKVWAMFPLAILVTAIFIKLSHRVSAQRVFYTVLSGFLIYFVVFAFILYPLQDYLHPHDLMDWLQARLPEGLKGFVAMLRYWTFSLFYGMCEMWGAMILTVLFWGFANNVTQVEEARRFYVLLGIGANLSSIAAGQTVCFLAGRNFNPDWPIGIDRWHQTLILLTLAVAAAGILTMLLFRWFNLHVMSTGSDPAVHHNQKLEQLKAKASIRDSFAYLFKSKYLLLVGLIVISYNVTINLTEVLWKSQMRELFPDTNAYSRYMGEVTSVTGIVSTILALAVAGNVVRRFGWTVGAIATPLMMLITSIGFFGCYLTPRDSLGVVAELLGTTPLALIVFFGSAQNCIGRSCKYTVFDATHELAFIPLPREVRTRGKAVIDGVVSRMGKSWGSVVYQVLLLFMGTFSRSAPAVSAILILILSGWSLAIRSLGRQFRQLAPGAAPSPPSAPTPARLATDMAVT
jgi:ATP:ADP antiporter, AAA family